MKLQKQVDNNLVTPDTWMFVNTPVQAKDIVHQDTKYTFYLIETKNKYAGYLHGDTKVQVRYFYDRSYSNNDQGIYFWVPACNLKVGDSIKINKTKNSTYWDGDGTYNDGYVLGWLFGDGCFTKNKKRQIYLYFCKDDVSIINTVCDMFNSWPQVRLRSDNITYIITTPELYELCQKFDVTSKLITHQIEKASSEFYVGFLSAIVDTDGSVCRTRKVLSISQSNLPMILSLQRMFSRFGIYCRVHKQNKEGTRVLFNNKVCKIKDSFILSIAGDNLKMFNEYFKLKIPHKKENMSYIVDKMKNQKRHYTEKWLDKIKSITKQQEYGIPINNNTVYPFMVGGK